MSISHQSRAPLTIWSRLWIQCTLAAFLLASLGGCSPSESQQAITSDANGFLCKACGEKIYTSATVFPTACPKCQKPDLVEVVGYYCAKDQFVTVAPRGPQSVPCEKCRANTGSLRLPRAKELQAWGAKKY